MSDRDPEPAFVPIAPNPYIVGTPVRDPSMFFGREAEFDLVRRRFQSPSEGGLLVFCGERRSGKTSILFQIVQGRLGHQFIPVLIDMQSMAIESEVQFLGKVSQEIVLAMARQGETVSPPDFTAGANAPALFQTFIESIVKRHSDKRLILLFDEYELFENKIDAGILAQDVMNILANLMEHHSVLLIFTGSQHVEQRRREYWKILGKSLYRHISYLRREDALSLIRKPVEGKVVYADGVVEAIYRLSAGQPFYTQAICQNIVDHLNECRARVVTKEILAKVVDGIVESPFPQMMFLWDGLEREERYVLALLAETLEGDEQFVPARSLFAAIDEAKYPLELGEPRIASTCEHLFEKELLLKNAESPPAYAFRTDLLRGWIRRMHSVWQVMRDEGIEIGAAGAPPLASPGRRLSLALAGLAGLAILLIFPGRMALRQLTGGAASGAGDRTAVLQIDPQPPEATVFQEGNPVAVGPLSLTLAARRNHAFRLAAPGYRDSSFVVNARAGDSLRQQVELQPLLGGVRVETMPEGAVIMLDGQSRGRSPLTVPGLPVTTTHVAQAILPGFLTTEVPFRVQPNTILTLSLVLATRSKDVYVTTQPSGATVLLDGIPRGRSPVTLRGVPHGVHTFGARMAGYSLAEFPKRVGDETGQLHLILTPAPRAAPP